VLPLSCLVGWDSIQISYQEIVEQIQSRTALVATQAKTVMHEVTVCVAVAIGSVSRDWVDSSRHWIPQLNHSSTHTVRTGSIHRVDSQAGAVASKNPSKIVERPFTPDSQIQRAHHIATFHVDQQRATTQNQRNQEEH
jgi:hypothetical protein